MPTHVLHRLRAVAETTDAADFKILFALFGNNFWIDDLRLYLVRAIQRGGLIYIPAIPSDPLLFRL